MFAKLVHPVTPENKHTPFITINGNVVDIKCGQKEMHPST